MSFPDFHVAVHDIIVEEDRTASRWTVTSTYQEKLIGIPPTGKQVTVTGKHMYRLAAEGTEENERSARETQSAQSKS